MRPSVPRPKHERTKDGLGARTSTNRNIISDDDIGVTLFCDAHHACDSGELQRMFAVCLGSGRTNAPLLQPFFNATEKVLCGCAW